AIDLFVERAHDVGAPLQADEHRTHLVDLVRLLDRLPLAIELAAARSRLLSPGALLARLRRRFDVLGIQARGLPERHRTLRATLQWSWELLTSQQRSVLAQLSVFEGGLTVEAAQGVVDLGTELAWVEDVLAELVEKGLLLVDDDERLRMLVSVQAFATEQLTDPEPAQTRHGAWFADFASTERGGRERYVEHDNLIVAARRAVERGDVAVAASVALEAAEIFFLRGPIQPGLDLVDDVLQLVREPKRRLALLRAQGRLINRLETPREAEGPHLEAVALAREAGIDDELAYHLGYLGELAADAGRWDEAAGFFEASADAARSDGRPSVMFVPLLRLARLALSMGQLELADERFTEVVALSHSAGRPQLLAHLHGLVGNLRVRQRRLADARASYTAAVQHARDRDDAVSIANWSIGLATVAESEANYAEAIVQVTDALDLADRVASPKNQMHLTAFLGYLQHRVGRREESERNLRRTLALAEARNHWRALQNARAELGHLLVLAGRLDEAEAQLTVAMEATRGRPNFDKKPWIHAYLGELRLRRGDLAGARTLFEVGLASAREAGDPIPTGRLAALYARCLDDVAEGRVIVEEALRTVREAHDIYELALVSCDQAGLELRLGDPARARRALEEARNTVADLALEPDAEVLVKIRETEHTLDQRGP
ncbi:MAG: hypothetical protein AAF211_21995, partial [Myxococcota bacterium]